MDSSIPDVQSVYDTLNLLPRCQYNHSRRKKIKNPDERFLCTKVRLAPISWKCWIFILFTDNVFHQVWTFEEEYLQSSQEYLDLGG